MDAEYKVSGILFFKPHKDTAADQAAQDYNMRAENYVYQRDFTEVPDGKAVCRTSREVVVLGRAGITERDGYNNPISIGHLGLENGLVGVHFRALNREDVELLWKDLQTYGRY